MFYGYDQMSGYGNNYDIEYLPNIFNGRID